MRQLLNVNLPYDAADRLPEPALALVVDALHEWAAGQHRTIAIYGMGEAGIKLFKALNGNSQFSIIASFDTRGQDRPGVGVVYTPDQLTHFYGVDLVINTTPPINLLDVLSKICAALSRCTILSLYDPVADMIEHSLHYEYWCMASMERETSDSIKELAKTLQNACIKIMHSWYERAAEVAPHLILGVGNDSSCHKLDGGLYETLSREQWSLGQYLNSRLDGALGCPKTESIDKLQCLAEEFPFFVLPRDAAATLLIQEGMYQQAVDIFMPVLAHYPFCHHTLAKAAELQILAGNYTEARAVLQQAQDIMPQSRQICTLIQSLLSGQATSRTRHTLENKWNQRTLRSTPKSRSTRLRIITPIWGETYISTFMRVTLASLLSEKNLPLASKTHDICYTVYTRKADEALLKSYPHWKALTDCVPVELIFIEDVLEQTASPKKHKYGLMSLLQTDGLQRSQKDGAHSFLLLGDFILSDSFLSNALHYLDKGVDTLFFQSMRTCEEGMLNRVVPNFTEGEQLSLSSVDLFLQGERYMHPAYRKHFIPGQVMRTPNSFYAKTTAGEIIQHTFAQNAMFVAPYSDSVEIHVTLDVDLGYSSADGGLGNYQLIQSNLEMMFFELTQEHEEANTHFAGKEDCKAYAYWAHRHMDPLNRYFGAFPTIFTNSSACPGFSRAQLDLSCKISALLV